MRTRIIVVLKAGEINYKFFSIMFSKADQSIFIYNHLKEENTPIKVSEPIHLLKADGEVSLDNLSMSGSDRGDSVHFSIHPNRLYLKKRTKDGRSEHLADEYEPQPFKNGFRLHCILSPAPLDHLPVFNKKRKNEEVEIFEWDSGFCPQVSIYEVDSSFDIENAEKVLPPGEALKVILSDGLHPTFVLQIKRLNSKLWRPVLSFFGKMIKKPPISKSELQRIINYNKLNFDISSLPENAMITDFKVKK